MVKNTTILCSFILHSRYFRSSHATQEINKDMQRKMRRRRVPYLTMERSDVYILQCTRKLFFWFRAKLMEYTYFSSIKMSDILSFFIHQHDDSHVLNLFIYLCFLFLYIFCNIPQCLFLFYSTASQIFRENFTLPNYIAVKCMWYLYHTRVCSIYSSEKSLFLGIRLYDAFNCGVFLRVMLVQLSTRAFYFSIAGRWYK